MRLGQLARKYDISQQEIISYLNEIYPKQEAFHSNSKLDEQSEVQVAKEFGFSLDEFSVFQENMSEKNQEKAKEDSTKHVIPDTNEVNEPDQNPLEILLPESEYAPLPGDQPMTSKLEAEIADPHEKEEVVIETDQLLELLESEEASIDLSRITRIKAPKKQLDGLKVVGKIELPEPKNKSEKVSEIPEQKPKSDRNGRNRSNKVSEEEREKRRLKAKKKKEQYETHQKERRRQKEKRAIKARKEAHYRQKIQAAKPIQPKLKVIEEKEELEILKVKDEQPKPKTFFGKIWRWLNT